jgi:hypothetical protein
MKAPATRFPGPFPPSRFRLVKTSDFSLPYGSGVADALTAGSDVSAPRGAIAASAALPAPVMDVFRFLARLENHWRLADRWIEVVSLEVPPGAPPGASADRGRVRIRGPLGIRRTARTTVVGAEPPLAMHGTAEVGGTTKAAISWSFADRGELTEVRLEAEIERSAALDRLLLAVGGRMWLRRRFRSVLVNLLAVFADAVPAGDGADAGAGAAQVEAEPRQ